MRPLVLISHILLFTIVHHAVFSPGSVSAQSEEQIRQYDILHKDGGWVTSPARRLAPINKSPENIVVITKQQILDMNAHTVAEILNRAPGLFVNFFGMDMGSVSLIYIEGSEGRNVLFLLDGMRLNFLSSGAAESNMIPVGSIERIEIIRGAASSAWGSALAGVVNIISKRGESLSGPEGMIQSAIGGNNT
ncbi:MAG: TonB-dependent receptor, partial [Desulfobacterales bacterium]|nr:TonB-dependent receptor [Desulfobacterales bacterium]